MKNTLDNLFIVVMIAVICYCLYKSMWCMNQTKLLKEMHKTEMKKDF